MCNVARASYECKRIKNLLRGQEGKKEKEKEKEKSKLFEIWINIRRGRKKVNRNKNLIQTRSSTRKTHAITWVTNSTAWHQDQQEEEGIHHENNNPVHGESYIG